MKRKIVWSGLILLLLFSLPPVFAQQLNTLKGTVYSLETGEPVPNATIVVLSSQLGTNSGQDGNFELRLPEERYRIRISSVGYAAKEVVIRVPEDGSDRVKIGLAPEKLEIGSVEVFGRYTVMRHDTSVNRIHLSLVPAVTRITAGEIEKSGATTLIDAMKFVPGGWTENRGRKTKQFFSVRGQKYPYPDYSINGIWQKEFEETGYFLSALDIESVEIVRSSGALVKGLSGLTGVIDVRTKKPEKETFSLTGKYGELHNYLTGIHYGNKIRKISFSTSASFLGSGGIPGRKGKERIANFHGELDWAISPKLKLAAGSTYIDGSREFVNIMEPGAPAILNREEKFDPIHTLITYVKMDYSGNDGSLSEFQTNMALRDVDFISYDIPKKTTTTTQEKDWEYGLNFLHSRPLFPRNRLRIGALYNHWVAPEGKRYYAGRRCDVHTFSGVVTDEQKAGRFLLDAGIRTIGGYITEWGGFGIEGSATGFQNVAPIADQFAPLEWQAILGASFIRSSSTSLHYNMAGGTIAPRKGSLTADGISPLTEVRIQHDLGLRIHTEKQDEFSASAFFTSRKNAIDLSGKTVTTGNNLLMELYENLDKRSYGLELSAKINIPALRSGLFANALFMKGEKESANKMMKDRQLPQIILNGGFNFLYAGFDANLYVNYTGRYWNNRFVNPAWVKQNGDFPLGDFLSVDWTGGYTFTGKMNVRVFAEIKNILDKKYMTVAGYPEPGRLFSAGMKLFL